MKKTMRRKPRIQSNPSRKARAKEFFSAFAKVRGSAAESEYNSMLTAYSRCLFDESGKPATLTKRGDFVQYMAHVLRSKAAYNLLDLIARDVVTYDEQNYAISELIKDAIDADATSTVMGYNIGVGYKSRNLKLFLLLQPFKLPTIKEDKRMHLFNVLDSAYGIRELARIASIAAYYCNFFDPATDLYPEHSKHIKDDEMIEVESNKDMAKRLVSKKKLFMLAENFFKLDDISPRSFLDALEHAIEVADMYPKEWKKFKADRQWPEYVKRFIATMDDAMVKEMASNENAEIRYFARDSGGKPMYPLTTDKLEWGEKIIEYPNKMVWVLLDSSWSQEEANGAAHCGNSPNRSNTNMRMLSLRQPHPKKPDLWKINMTVVMDRDEGFAQVFEAKGYGNSRPTKYYSQYYDLLLWWKQNGYPFSDISGNRGWMTYNNARPEHFPPEIFKRLVKDMPEAISENIYHLIKFPDLVKPTFGNEGQLRGVQLIEGVGGPEAAKTLIKLNRSWQAHLLKNKAWSKIDLYQLMSGGKFFFAYDIWKEHLKDPKKFHNDLNQFMSNHGGSELAKDKNFAAWMKENMHLVYHGYYQNLGLTWLQGIQNILKFQGAILTHTRGKSLYFDKDGDLRMEFAGMLAKSAKEHLKASKIKRVNEASINMIQNMLEEWDGLTTTDWQKILKMFPFLMQNRTNILKAHKIEDIIENPKKYLGQDIRFPKINKDGLFLMSTDKDLAAFMDWFKNGLDDYSHIIREGYVDIYGHESLRDQDKIQDIFMPFVSHVRKKYPKYFNEHKNLLMTYHDAEPEYNYRRDLHEDDESIWSQGENSEKLLETLDRARLYAEESATFDSLYVAVNDYIKELGIEKQEYDEKGELKSYGDQELIKKWLRAYIMDESTDDVALYILDRIKEDAKSFSWRGDVQSGDQDVIADHIMQEWP